MSFPAPLAALSAVLLFGLTSSIPVSAEDSMLLDLKFRESLSKADSAGRTDEARPLPAQRPEGARRLKGRPHKEARLSQRRDRR